MANTYNIAFDLNKQFAVVGQAIQFNVLNDNERVTGLEADLTASGANGSTFNITANTEGDYDYTMTVVSVATGTNIPDELSEAVTVLYQNEAFESQPEVSLEYLYKDVPSVNGYIGDVVTMSWDAGTVEVSDIANEEVATAEGAAITLVGAGSTTCTLTYTLGEETQTVENVAIVVTSPSVTAPEVTSIDSNDAALTATSTPANVTMLKFRYGLSEEFNPEDDTTYTEVEADLNEGVGTYDITELTPQTEYAAQSVIIYEGNTYVSEVVYFSTLAYQSEMTISEDMINLVGVASFTDTFTASVEKVNDSSTINWEVTGPGDLNIQLNINDNQVEVTVNYNVLNESIPASKLTSQVNLVATEVLDESVINTTTGQLPVYIYPVVNHVTLYVDEGTNTALQVILEENSMLQYAGNVAGEGEGTYYSYDEDNKSVTGIAAGDGLMTNKVTLEGVETITDYEYQIDIEVLNAFEYPTKEELINNAKIFNYKSEMFGDYPGKSLKIYEVAVAEGSDVTVPFYLFRTNSPAEIKWEYDICALGSDIDKITLSSL